MHEKSLKQATSSMKMTILIPCHNEEQTIGACVESCLRQTLPADQLLVVDDGSTDATPQILASFGNRIQVVRIAKKTGAKSKAQEAGLKHVTGDIIITTDADTLLEPTFVEYLIPHFEDPKVGAVAGYVKSLKSNWLTAIRALDYSIGQNIHKLAQSYIGAVYVMPGCGTAFRRDLFGTCITFEHDTLTEDLDFTYKIHEQNMKILFEKRAYVYTQDPSELASYINQMRRWYCGGWQNLAKHTHKITSRPRVTFEISLMYSEMTFFSVLAFAMPMINTFLTIYSLAMYLIFLYAFAIFACIKERRLDILFYAPCSILVSYINAWLFLEQGLKVFFGGGKKSLTWFQPPRRELRKISP